MANKFNFVFSRRAAWGLTLWMLTSSAMAELPKGEQILDRYVEVTGGKAAYEKIKSRVSKGTFEVAGADIKGKIELYHAAPNKLVTIVDMENLGKMEEGTDGALVWSSNPMMGPSIKEGDELEAFKRAALFNAELIWRKVYKKVETVGEEQVDGRTLYKVELTPEKGKPETHYFDKETGLRTRSMVVTPTQMGELPVETFVEDYRVVDGIRIPHRMRQKLSVQESIITFEQVEHNVDIPASRFEPPAEVKELQAGKASGEKPAADKPGSDKP